MPTLHVIDPLLKHQGGHFLGQHLALWQLCRRAGFDMISYCDHQFDESLAPQGVKIVKSFGCLQHAVVAGHYCVGLGVANQRCLEELLDIDISSFGDNDVVFLTSATAERVVAYGQWLRTFIGSFKGKVGIYTTVSAELDDTIARQLRRNQLTISEETFSILDDVVVGNDLKLSMYRYLFDSIPPERSSDFKIFYEEPFPNRRFLDLCQDPKVDFVYLHSMYPGMVDDRRGSSRKGLMVAYLGSGGVGDDNKGHHLLEGIISRINQRYSDVDFAIHLGNAERWCVTDALADVEEALSRHDNVSILTGFLDCDDYCGLIETADIVILPYGPRYWHVMSGIFDDCLFLGTPCVIPVRSKMALWLERHNIDFSGFSRWNVEEVVRALGNVLENYTHYSKEFGEAQRICRARWLRCNPFAVFGIPLDKQVV